MLKCFQNFETVETWLSDFHKKTSENKDLDFDIFKGALHEAIQNLLP